MQISLWPKIDFTRENICYARSVQKQFRRLSGVIKVLTITLPFGTQRYHLNIKERFFMTTNL